MRNIVTLVKFFIGAQLRQVFAEGKRKRNKIIQYTAVFIILSILFISSIRNSYRVLFNINNERLIVPIIFTIISIISFVYSIFLIISTLCFANDNEFLLKFPVSVKDIFISKIIYIYISLLPITIFAVPSIATYGVLSKARISTYIYAVISVFFIAILPILYGAIISIIINALGLKAKHKTLFKNISSLIIVLLVVAVGFMLISVSMSEDTINSYLGSYTADKVNILELIFPTNILLSKLFLCDTYESIKYLFILLLFTAAIFTLTIFICKGMYERILFFSSDNSSSKYSSKSNNIKMNSPLKALVKRDILNLIRNSQLFLYSFGFLFMSMLVIISCIPIFFLTGIAESFKTNCLALILCLTIFSLGISGFNNVSASSFSREGKYMYVLKTFPDISTALFHSKLITAVIVNSITLVFDLIILLICRQRFFISMAVFVVCILTVIFNVVMGVYTDISNPNLTWINEKDMMQNDLLKVLKPAIYTNIATFFLIILLFIFKSKGVEYTFIIMFLCSLIMLLILIIHYYKKAFKRYKAFFDNLV